MPAALPRLGATVPRAYDLCFSNAVLQVCTVVVPPFSGTGSAQARAARQGKRDILFDPDVSGFVDWETEAGRHI